jgi:TonB family protein
LVLASDEEGRAIESLRFSLASDIVELVVLTGDEGLLQVFREAVGGARRLWHVPSSDKVSDLLVAGEVGIVVIDVQVLHEAATVFIGQIKRQFPDLVVVVAGNRGDETALAGLISAGIVYRFIHKPMSPARAKLFAEAAIKKHDEQRQRAAQSPQTLGQSNSSRAWMIGGLIGVAAVVAAIMAFMHQSPTLEAISPGTESIRSSAVQSPLLARAAAALSANRLTEPAGDNALELYQQVLAGKPSDAEARSGLTEVHERLLARAENALLEERLDEAALAIEVARKSGVEGGRIAFLTAQLAKSRDQIKAAQAQSQSEARARSAPKAEDKVTPLLDRAKQSLADDHLLKPDGDNARFYIEEALRVDPDNPAAQDAQSSLALRLLGEAHGAIDRRDFTLAASLLEGANGVASPANIEATQGLLAAARQQADVDAWNQLLKNANERLQQDRLIEPANDNAKYFLLTLRALDPGNSALGAATQDLGARMMAKARRALALQQYAAARSWLDEESAIGFSSAELDSVQRELEAAVAQQKFWNTIVPAAQLRLLKSVPPAYPPKAALSKTEGWVDLDFTVSETGQVTDISVRTASVAGIFEDAAVKAVSQWRYQPVMRESKAVPVRTQIRVRFSLS